MLVIVLGDDLLQLVLVIDAQIILSDEAMPSENIACVAITIRFSTVLSLPNEPNS